MRIALTVSELGAPQLVDNLNLLNNLYDPNTIQVPDSSKPDFKKKKKKIDRNPSSKKKTGKKEKSASRKKVPKKKKSAFKKSSPRKIKKSQSIQLLSSSSKSMYK